MVDAPGRQDGDPVAATADLSRPDGNEEVPDVIEGLLIRNH